MYFALKSFSTLTQRVLGYLSLRSSQTRRMNDIAGWTRGLMAVLFCALLTLGSTLSAQAQTVIYQDDFESGPTGWSNNTIENAPILGTNFLGRFTDGSEETTRTFTVPAGATALEIEFDLLRFDSWDFYNAANNDGFAVEIDGVSLFSTTAGFGTFDVLPFGVGQGGRSGSTGNVDWRDSRHNPTRRFGSGH